MPFIDQPYKKSHLQQFEYALFGTKEDLCIHYSGKTERCKITEQLLADRMQVEVPT